jgi:transcription termination/antitermination protein NusG
MTQDLTEKTDAGEKVAPEVEGEAEQPDRVDAPEAEAPPAPEEKSPDVETSETEGSAAGEPPSESEVSESEEAPDVESPSGMEESADGEVPPEVGDTTDVEAVSDTEAPIEETEAPPKTEAQVDVEEPSEVEPVGPDADAAVETVAEDEAAEPEELAEDTVAGDGGPFAGPGEWYVIHTYAGYENKVKTNLGSRIQTMQMQDKIFDVVVPMEDVMEIKGGRKQVVQKKVFPGYLLVKMLYDNDSWYVVRNTPGVTGFVSSGTGQKPTPLPRREVEKFLAAKSEETKPAFRLEYEEGDVVRIISGPFTDFTGTITEINVDQSKLKVMVNIFDRETPVELGFDQVAKV